MQTPMISLMNTEAIFAIKPVRGGLFEVSEGRDGWAYTLSAAELVALGKEIIAMGEAA
jgi:hypothetical protein